MQEENGHSLGQEKNPNLDGREMSGPAGRISLPNEQLKPNRGDLILFFGLISLLCCWPLGIAAWIMGSSDLKGIRAGSVSSEGLGTLKAGRILGIVGTVIFALSVSAAIIAGITVPAKLPDLKLSLKDKIQEWLKRSTEDLKPVPLPKEKLPFAGEWTGDRGTVLRIYPNGRGDYKGSTGPGRTNSLSGGRVRIEGEKLSVGLFGIERTFHIDKPPARENGTWTMTLSGEVFTRKRTLQSPPGPNDSAPGRPKEYEARNDNCLNREARHQASAGVTRMKRVQSGSAGSLRVGALSS